MKLLKVALVMLASTAALAEWTKNYKIIEAKHATSTDGRDAIVVVVETAKAKYWLGCQTANSGCHMLDDSEYTFFTKGDVAGFGTDDGKVQFSYWISDVKYKNQR